MKFAFFTCALIACAQAVILEDNYCETDLAGVESEADSLAGVELRPRKPKPKTSFPPTEASQTEAEDDSKLPGRRQPRNRKPKHSFPPTQAS